MGLTTFGLALATALIASPRPADLPDASATLEQPPWPPARHSRVWPDLTLELHTSLQGRLLAEPAAAPVAAEHLNREDVADAQDLGCLALGASGRAQHLHAVPTRDLEDPEPARELKRPVASTTAEDAEASHASLDVPDADALRRRIELLDLRLQEFDGNGRVERKVGETVAGLFFWPAVGAVVGILYGFGSGTGAKAFLENLAFAGGLGAACGAVVAIGLGLVSIISEYRSVSRERAALLQEREELQDRLKAHLQAIPFPGIGAPVVAVRF